MNGKSPLFIFGGTGFVGRSLLAGLAGRGYAITCLVRTVRGVETVQRLGARPVIGDVLQPETYSSAIRSGSIVIYLIHTMGFQRQAGDFEDLDRRAARTMLEVSRQAGVALIIHLSGLFDSRENLSRHLASRAEVAELIRRSGIPAIILRASIIFGQGSASYEILKAALALPVVPLPPWRQTRVQPIAIGDVIRSLIAAIERPELAGRTLDIAGPEVFTYGELLRRFAASLGLKRRFFNVPFGAHQLAALLLSRLSDIGVRETYALLESLRNTSIVSGENAIVTVFGFQSTPVF